MSRLFFVQAAIITSIVAFGASTLAAGKIPEKNIHQPEQGNNLGSPGKTQMQPDGKWRMHDPKRPQPEVAEPKYDGEPVEPPEDAKVLFDGKNTDKWTKKNWQVKDGYMIAGPSQQETKEKFGDMHLHIEWRIPTSCIKGWNQHQGNSGVFLMKRYEIQVLNGWGNRTYADGTAGAVYGQTPPLVNACRKPDQWNAYDIHFKAPVFQDGKLKEEAYVTVYLNNVLVQDNTRIWGPTSWKKVARYKPHGDDVIQLQWHGNRVHYRNIWVAPLKKELGPDAPKEQDKNKDKNK